MAGWREAMLLASGQSDRILSPSITAVELAAEDEFLPASKGFIGPELLVERRTTLGVLFVIVCAML